MRNKVSLKSGLIGGLMLIGLFWSGGAAHADTRIMNDITTDTRWTVVGSPYIIRPEGRPALTITRDATLRIDPGVIVQFAPRTGMVSEGRLLARGTLKDPVVFTSRYSGDRWSIAYPGDWHGLYVTGSGSLLRNTEIRYAGRPDFAGHRQGASLFLNGQKHQIENTLIENGAGHGIRLHYAYGSTLRNNLIQYHRGHGIEINHSRENELFRNLVQGNERDGIRIVNLGDGLFRANQIRGNQGHGIYMDTLGGPDIQDNQIQKNEKTGIYIQAGYPRIHHNSVDRNENGIVIRQNWPQRIHDNDLYKNRLNDFSVANASRRYGVVDVRGNWWGSSFGPFSHKISRHLNTEDWLTSPATQFTN